MHNKIESFIEAVLWKSRWMVLLAVIGSILAALVLMILGAVDIAVVLKNGLQLAAGAISSEHFQETTVGIIIRAVDAFLIGTVMLIFGLGLYELFICKIHAAEGESGSANVLVVHSLDQLKEKIGKVIIMVLVVTFFKHALDMTYSTIVDLVWLTVGILFCAIALFLLGYRNHKAGEK
ncbi:MAG: YqhA family protein [Verrucomicrobiae bacterium]